MELEELQHKIRDCKKCELCKSRKFTVFGEGDPNAKIMFIGEAPGFDEDQSGLPFVGEAGQVFNELLRHINLDRKKIFIANVLKCRPPKNADPTPEQISCCSEHLDAQLLIIKPKVICPMGNFATQFVFKKFGLTDKITGIMKLKGTTFNAKDSYGNDIVIVPLLHPAVVTYNRTKLPELQKDIEVLLYLDE